MRCRNSAAAGDWRFLDLAPVGVVKLQALEHAWL
jgi:hypothetical protein